MHQFELRRKILHSYESLYLMIIVQLAHNVKDFDFLVEEKLTD